MAIEKTFQTRILLKYDTYENWKTNNPVLKKGEVAIATIPSNQDDVVNAPSTLIKVGDGTNHYNDLQFLSGKAADVYSWAKAATKPTYQASEITGLSDYIAGEVQNTNTTYSIRKINDYKYQLQSKELGDTSFTDVADAVIEIPDDTAAITALQTLVGNTAVATQIANAIAALNLAGTYEAKGEAAKVQAALNTYKTSNDAAVKANADAITAIKDGSNIDSFADVETALSGKQAVGDYATKTEAQGYADAKDSAIAAAKKAGDDAQADVDALKAKVGTVADGKTVVEMISDAQTAATYDDTALTGRVTTVEGKVSTLVGTTEGDEEKSARTIAAEEVAKIIAGADTAYDTLKEIADWISNHKTDAAAMNSAITALEGLVGNTAVSAQITAAIDALKIEDYAKAADLTAAAARITALEGKAHEHANKTVIDGITDAQVTGWDDAAAKKHTHANATTLDGITDTKVAAWDSAIQTVTAGTGLTATKTGTDVAIGLDDTVTFIFDCGTSANC